MPTRNDSCSEKNDAVKKLSNADVRRHIRRIKKAKLDTDKIFVQAQMDAAEASIEILWEIIFDYLCGCPSLSPSEITSLSGIVQKLAASRVQLANFATKRFDNDSSNHSSELNKQAIEKIENALNLL